MARAMMRVASGSALLALARGQVNCGETVPSYPGISPTPGVGMFTSNNPSPVECRNADNAALAGMLWTGVVAACAGSIPDTYTGPPYGEGTTEAQCQADLCEATPACTAAIEAYGTGLQNCNPPGNFMASVYKAVAWRDACVGTRAITAILATAAVRPSAAA
jgi:hypothetical protein